MTLLSFELAKELKEAGWPQPEEIHFGEGVRLGSKLSGHCYSPSLSELIAGCVELLDGRFVHISISGDKCACCVARPWFTLHPEKDPGVKWFDASRIEEAVARLWLELKRKGVV